MFSAKRTAKASQGGRGGPPCRTRVQPMATACEAVLEKGHRDGRISDGRFACSSSRRLCEEHGLRGVRKTRADETQEIRGGRPPGAVPRVCATVRAWEEALISIRLFLDIFGYR